MLTQLEVLSPRITTPLFPLVAEGMADTDALQIVDIKGLVPVAASINTEKYASIDGEWFSGATTPSRNIVITIRLNPDWSTHTYESLRQKLYAYFMPKSMVTLRFHSTHMNTVGISGYVETMEPNIFSKDTEYQVSILCPQPYFEDLSPTVVTGETAAIGTTTPIVVPMVGTVPVGVIFTLEKGVAASDLTNGTVQLFNESPDAQLLHATTVTVTATQYLEVSTIPGNKFARYRYTSGSNPTSVVSKVVNSSDWVELVPGDNNVRVLTTVTGMLWTLRYTNRYGGL